MADITILEEQTLSGFEDVEGVGYLESPALFPAFTAGTDYRILWDGTEYICTAMSTDGAGFVGNVSIGDPSAADTGEPFIIMVIPGALIGAPVDVMVINTTQTGTEHTLAVYEIGEEETIPSATVKIKGYSGAEFTYENVPKVLLAAPESTMDNPVLVPFTYGEAVDNVEVIPDFSAGDHKLKLQAGELIRSAVVKKPDALIPGNIKAGETVAGVTGTYDPTPETEEVAMPADFSDGDMVLEPSEGKYLAKATVQMPETLIPENVAEGVNIAGIIGMLKAGGSVVMKYGTVTGTGARQTIQHGLGVVPDIFYIQNNNFRAGVGGIYCFTVFSEEIKNVAGLDSYGCGVAYKSGWSGLTQTLPITDASELMVANANENTIEIGNSTKNMPADTPYVWIAIGGLT